MMKTIISGKNIILGVGGGIAAYKSVDLLRKLVKLGANVQVMMTNNAAKFVGPMTFETLSSNHVLLDLFDKKCHDGIPHIELTESADAVVLAPATANIIAKVANGIADDALSTSMLAVTCPVVICPSMNSNMYEHPATQKNLNLLIQYGYYVLSVNVGELACGISGPGRLPEPSEIIDRLMSYLTPSDMTAKRILITAGPTQELIDPVRFISNPSSGKMGYALARAAEYRGADVTLISGPVSINAPLNVDLINIQSASEMAEVVFENLDAADIVIKVAAVSDYRPRQFSSSKIKKGCAHISLNLEKNLDILEHIGKISKKRQVIVGFAAETCDLVLNAQRKLREKNLDMIVVNFVGLLDSAFSSDMNRVLIFFSNGSMEEIDVMSKDLLSHVLLDRIALISLEKENLL